MNPSTLQGVKAGIEAAAKEARMKKWRGFSSDWNCACDAVVDAIRALDPSSIAAEVSQKEKK